MLENTIEEKEPLWMLIEKEIQKYTDEDFTEANSLETSRKIGEEIDKTGYNVSKHGGNWMRLTAAVKARNRVGRPFIQDFDQAVSGLGLDDIKDSYTTAMKIIRDLGDNKCQDKRIKNDIDIKEAEAETEENKIEIKIISADPDIEFLVENNRNYIRSTQRSKRMKVNSSAGTDESTGGEGGQQPVLDGDRKRY